MALITKKIIPFIQKPLHAFQILVKPDPSSPDKTVANIGMGTVNNIIPNNILVGGVLRNFSLTKDTLQYVLLKASSNGKTINAAEITISQEPPKAQTPVAFGLPSSVEIFIGGIYNDTIYQGVDRNIVLDAKTQYITTNINNAGLPYNVFFIWGQSN